MFSWLVPSRVSALRKAMDAVSRGDMPSTRNSATPISTPHDSNQNNNNDDNDNNHDQDSLSDAVSTGSSSSDHSKAGESTTDPQTHGAGEPADRNSSAKEGSGVVVVVDGVDDKQQELLFFSTPKNLGNAHCTGEALLWSGQFKLAESLLQQMITQNQNQNPKQNPQQKQPPEASSSSTENSVRDNGQLSAAGTTDDGGDKRNEKLEIATSLPHATLLLAEASLMRLMVTGDDNLIEEGLRRVETALDVASSHSPPSLPFGNLTPQQTITKHECTVFTAHALLLRSLLEGFQGRFIKAPLTATQSWREFLSVPEDSPSRLARAMRLYGVGLFQLTMSFAPAAVQTAFRLVGLSPSRNGGIHSLHMAVRNGSWNWAPIALIGYRLLLSAQPHHTREENISEVRHAEALLECFVKNTPNACNGHSVFPFNWLGCEVAKRSGNYLRAEEYIHAVVNSLGDVEQPLYRLNFVQVHLLFVQRKYQEALVKLEPLTTVDCTYNSKAFALIFLGACHGQLGDNNAANAAWGRIITEIPEDSKGDLNKMLTRKARVLVERNNAKIAGYELLFLLGYIRTMTPDFVRELCEPTLALSATHKNAALTKQNVEEIAAIRLVCGVVHNCAGNPQKAMEMLTMVIDAAKTSEYDKAVEDKFHAACAWYEIGVVFSSLGMYKEAGAALKKCRKCGSDFSFSEIVDYQEKTARRHVQLKLKQQKRKKLASKRV